MEPLPIQLSNAIDRELATLAPDKLQEACYDLTQRYAQGHGMETQLHRQAYIAARLPATYGAIRQVFRYIEPLLPPLKSVLDLGAGTGSVAWAAADSLPHLQRMTLFEKDIELLRLGQHLVHTNLDPIQLAWCREDITQAEIFPTHDATVLSYVLNELSIKEQMDVLERAYNATDKLLILIEPGTPQGFGHLLNARNFLLKLGAYSIAPCPHNNPCPLSSAFEQEKDWCHFSVRIPRGKYHKQAKDGTLPFEDEKFAYLVVSPHPSPLPKGRIIKNPLRKKGHVILDLCTDKGEEKRTIIAKSQGKAYQEAKQKEWGDVWERKDIEE